MDTGTIAFVILAAICVYVAMDTFEKWTDRNDQ